MKKLTLTTTLQPAYKRILIADAKSREMSLGQTIEYYIRQCVSGAVEFNDKVNNEEASKGVDLTLIK